MASVINLCAYHPVSWFLRTLPGTYGMLSFGHQVCRPMMGKSIERLLPLAEDSYTVELLCGVSSDLCWCEQ